MFIRTQYNYDMNAAGDESGIDCSNLPSMTKQSFAEEVDINTIVERFGITGELPAAVRMPEYGDFEGVDDFQTAMNAIATANESFDALPAKVRARFHNSPQEFIEFCWDDKNHEEARKLGIIPEAEIKAAEALASPPPKAPPEGAQEPPAAPKPPASS